MRWERALEPGADLSVQLFHTYVDTNKGFLGGPCFGYYLPLDLDVRTESLGLCEQTILTNGQLDAERITAYELGYNLKLADLRTMVDIRLFREELSDVIGMYFAATGLPSWFDVVEPGAWDFVNGDDILLTGIETQLDYRPERHSGLRLAYSYTRVEADDHREQYSRSVPRHSASLFLFHRFPNDLRASLLYSFTSVMTWLGDGSTVEPARRLDLRLAKPWHSGGVRGQLELVLQNVLGEYHDFVYQNSFAPQAYLQLSLQVD